ncbi:hypothetical protein PFISCL1PPCAC_9058, partial [Pristionchus fissidentatus]
LRCKLPYLRWCLLCGSLRLLHQWFIILIIRIDLPCYLSWCFLGGRFGLLHQRFIVIIIRIDLLDLLGGRFLGGTLALLHQWRIILIIFALLIRIDILLHVLCGCYLDGRFRLLCRRLILTTLFLLVRIDLLGLLFDCFLDGSLGLLHQWFIIIIRVYLLGLLDGLRCLLLLETFPLLLLLL